MSPLRLEGNQVESMIIDQVFIKQLEFIRLLFKTWIKIKRIS